MKILTSILLALMVLVAFASPVMAYDPPAQGTDNATDIIIWYGDNLTVSGDFTITSGELTITGVEDFLTSVLLLLIVVGITALAFWQKQNIMLWIVACPVAVVYGLTTAAGATINSSLWVAGIAVAVIGLYCLYKVVMIGLEGFKK